ncbi:MAG TPA: aldose epimerase family protein [Terrimicrobiaceae bacterium]|nr:aldose epimerase family protein [Terrimicrobiaceae bacterium]
MKNRLLAALISLGAILMNFPSAHAAPPVVRPFGTLPDGREVRTYTLANDTGMTVTLTDYGAAVLSILVPDRGGAATDVVLGFDDLAGYLSAENPYFGCTVGRFANRISSGSFSLDGKSFQLARNDGDHHLHGGPTGFSRQLWKAEVQAQDNAIRFHRISPDGEEGFPGSLAVSVTYALERQGNALRITYEATTDRPTILNLTNHTYFNLAGAGSVLDHRVRIDADRHTVAGAGNIPTGAIADVQGTPLDLRQAAPIGSRLEALGGTPSGFDHNYVLNPGAARGETAAAEVEDPKTGRVLQVFTHQPGLQFYTANYLNGSFAGKSGTRYAQHAGFCLETQHFPDAPNHENFPSTVLRPGEIFRSQTTYVFGTR